MKVIKYVFLFIWTVWCLFRISQNYSHYGLLDWLISLSTFSIPYLILWYLTYRNVNKTKNDVQNINKGILTTVKSQEEFSAQNIALLLKQCDSQLTLNIDNDKMISHTDGKDLSDEEIPHLIQEGLKERIQQDTVTHNYPMYMNMRIVSNIMPAQENYAFLNDNEKLFFQAFYKQLINASLSPSLVTFTRMSDGGFNVDYISLCYIGKINLHQPPIKYAVIKKGNKRATKVFDTLQEAESYISQNSNYEILIRQPQKTNSMQYLRGFSTIKNLSDLSVEQCIEYIPYWIRYIRYCKRK